MTLKEFKRRRDGLILSPDPNRREGGIVYSDVLKEVESNAAHGVSDEMDISKAAEKCLREELGRNRSIRLKYLRELIIKPISKEETKNLMRRHGARNVQDVGRLMRESRSFHRIDPDVVRELTDES